MKVPVSWLRELLATDAPPSLAETIDLLTVSGTAVEAVEHVGVTDADGAGGEHFRVGRVLEFEQHPDADKLRLVRVDTGDVEPRQIVCGATNFATGDTVAVVVPGGVMPDGTNIRAAKLRGVESRGMMLSERELGLSTDHAGIMVLPSSWEPGSRLGAHLPLGDEVLELEITGNRPDCLGVLGVARELATAAGVALDTSTVDPDVAATASGDVADHVEVQLDADDLCARYMARAFVDVRVAPSPTWLVARLARAGMRAINNVVDVTNYVMLATGQPLHAFDADSLRGGRIVVRRSHADETVTTLDGVERTLPADTLVIADAERTAVIAGVMGAADVEVGDATTRLVLEAACFDGLSVQRTSRALGLRSESSSRFEKGLDPHLPELALRMASRLLVELCGAALVPGTVDAVAGGALAEPSEVELPVDLAERVLGIEVDEDATRTTLTSLGYEVGEERSGAWPVRVPHWRMFDTTRAIDLVEELGRFRLDEIPALLPPVASGGAMLTPAQRLRRAMEDAAVGAGLHEVVTYGMQEAGTAEGLGMPKEDVVALANPMTADHAELRTSLVPAHLTVARRNVAASQHDIAIFEVGRTFRAAAPGAVGADGLPRFADERDVLGVLLSGTLGGARWDAAGIEADFGAAAGTALALLQAGGVAGELHPLVHPQAWLHPGQAAELRAPGGDGAAVVVGWVAGVHPGVAARHGVERPCFAVHLDLERVLAARPPQRRFRSFSEFPPVVEDIALVLADDVRGGEVVRAAQGAGGDLLERVEVFDRYVGAPIPDGNHSLALRLTFRAADRTLTDAETASVRAQVVAHLEQEFGASLRGQ